MKSDHDQDPKKKISREIIRISKIPRLVHVGDTTAGDAVIQTAQGEPVGVIWQSHKHMVDLLRLLPEILEIVSDTAQARLIDRQDFVQMRYRARKLLYRLDEET